MADGHPSLRDRSNRPVSEWFHCLNRPPYALLDWTHQRQRGRHDVDGLTSGHLARGADQIRENIVAHGLRSRRTSLALNRADHNRLTRLETASDTGDRSVDRPYTTRIPERRGSRHKSRPAPRRSIHPPRQSPMRVQGVAHQAKTPAAHPLAQTAQALSGLHQRRRQPSTALEGPRRHQNHRVRTESTKYRMLAERQCSPRSFTNAHGTNPSRSARHYPRPPPPPPHHDSSPTNIGGRLKHT